MPLNLKQRWFGAIPLMVAASLADQPERWTADLHTNDDGEPYTLAHDSGLVLWTANEAYGMDIRLGGKLLWGGVTLSSTFRLSPGHWLLRGAADRWIRRHRGSPPGSAARAAQVRQLLRTAAKAATRPAAKLAVVA
jgi:hypothetical protein